MPEDTSVEEAEILEAADESAKPKVPIWKTVIFAVLALLIVLILLGVFRFLVVSSYGGP